MIRSWANGLVSLLTVAAIIVQSACTAALKVPESDYASQNDDPAKRYRIVTTGQHIYIATRIETTDSTVTILALENHGEILLFDAKRYEDVGLPLTLHRRDISSVARLEKTKQRVIYGVILTPLAVVFVLGLLIAAGGGLGPMY